MLPAPEGDLVAASVVWLAPLGKGKEIMANELKYIGTVKDGKLTLSDRKGLDRDLLNLEGKRVLVSIKVYRKSRSLRQNNYYFGIVLNFVRDGLVDMGFERNLLSLENVHEMLKAKFLKQDYANDEGEFISLVKSTTDLSTVEFSEFIDDIIKWSSEFLNIQIPLPNEQSEINF